MKDEIVSYETAVLAKEKGFNEYCEKRYKKKRLINSTTPKYVQATYGMLPLIEGVYHAPAQSLLQKWLRDEKIVNVEINLEEFNTTLYYSCTIFGTDYKYTNGIYELALEKGLRQALRLI